MTQYGRNIPMTTRREQPFVPQFYGPLSNQQQAAPNSMFAQNPAFQPAQPIPAVRQFNPAQQAQQSPGDDCNQLDLKALMPLGWGQVGAKVAAGDDKDWSRYTVTEEGFHKYVSGTGFARINKSDRSYMSKTSGKSAGIGFFRNPVLPKLDIGPDSVVFNDSSERQALVSSEHRNYYGC